MRSREFLAIGLLVALADATLYRGHGLAGYALLSAVAPWLLVLGSPRPRFGASVWIVGGMLMLLAARMIWLGSELGAIAGLFLLVAFAMSVAGEKPYVLDVVAYALQTIVAGFQTLGQCRDLGQSPKGTIPRTVWLSIALPLAAVAAFGTLFVLANPDLVTSTVDLFNRLTRTLSDWLVNFAPRWDELLFWAAVAWVALGLLRPVLRGPLIAAASTSGLPAMPTESPLYAAMRNTLVAVIGLFGVYLAFEFKTLWFRVFPKGFYYAGYAHEGAAWLTVALALATVVLSLIFRGRLLGDPRLARIRRLAWLWSAENLLLALAVYHRLYIYIGFNGMTRMRTNGLFGTSAVVVGFFLVLWKILYQRDFVWLLQRHLWTLAIVVYLYALTPVDAIVHTYNVRRVLAGDPAPAVQITEHPVDSEGVLVLHSLVNCQDKIIREGIRAMLAQRAAEVEANVQRWDRDGWTSYQAADRVLLNQLRAVRSDWAAYADPDKRYGALSRFRQYAYQWY
jgi:hypothetical protein